MDNGISSTRHTAEMRMPSDDEVTSFMDALSLEDNPERIQRLAMEFLVHIPIERRLAIASALAFANPFFLPDMDPDSARSLGIDIEQFAELTMRAKLTAKQARQPNILLACAPKSASTFISGALADAMNVPRVNLSTPCHSAMSSSVLGANLRSQEMDDLALIRNGLNRRGYVAQHHVRCTPFLAQQIRIYNLKVIVTIRNFFDSLVSMDDMVTEWRGDSLPVNQRFFDDGLPAGYERLPFEERLEILVDVHAAWYAQFLVSWKKCEAFGLVAPLWISYEHDFQGDKAVLAERISAFIGCDDCKVERLAEALQSKEKAKALRLNKGIAGRGRVVPDAIRDRATALLRRYQDDCDLSLLV